MKRVIIAPAALPAAALVELKQWLGVNSTRDDALLASLLDAAIDLCESYTGIRPIDAECEEIAPVRPALWGDGWQSLSTRPVSGITGVDAIADDNGRTPLPIENYAIELDADGTGRFRILNAGTTRRVAVRYRAGLAPEWDDLPEPLKQGIVRLAAHHHRSRESGSGDVAPPAAVAALWQPWRRMRLL